MKLIYIFLLSIFLVSCQTIKVSVSSISAPESMEKSNIFLAPGDPNIPLSDLLFREFSEDVKIALIQNGYNVVDDLNQADQVAFIAYGISDPKTQIISIPLFGPTSVSSSNTTGNMIFNQSGGTYQGTTTYNYNYGITGFTNYSSIYFTRVIFIIAIDWKTYLHNKVIIPQWQTHIISNGSNSDLRSVFPFMIYAAEKYIGKNTEKAIDVSVMSIDKGVEKYKNN